MTKYVLKAWMIAWLVLGTGCTGNSNDVNSDVSAAEDGGLAEENGEERDDSDSRSDEDEDADRDTRERDSNSSEDSDAREDEDEDDNNDDDEPEAEDEEASTGAMAPAGLECDDCDGLCLFGFCFGGGGNGPSDGGLPDFFGGGPRDNGCQTDDDCESGVCTFFSCRDPSCGDDVCNGDETAASCSEDCPSGCGDGVVTDDEECDDGNTETEACDYGQESCLVCDEGCKEIAGAAHYCGDGVI
ncbi:MAG: hypothetical protein OXR73_17750, partial [Myxococcales bacterium]|nr:hypothetical protein [Myxococcales bacterium]